jgi:carboxypeptidase family protein/TonB-dependent receptor-like protein
MRRAFRAGLCAVVLLLVAAGGAIAQSQATTGVIQGRVTSEGAPVVGASVVVTNTNTNFEKALSTDSAGRFRGVLLPLGPYRIVVAADGYSNLTREGVQLGVGQTLDLELALQPPTVTEAITVSAEAPVIEVSRTQGTVRIDSEAVEGLPNNGRNFLDFVKLTPGVTIVQGPDGDELSINGQKGISNNISVDGADFNNPFFGEQRGGQRPPFTFNLDAVEEVVVVADGAQAEFGRSSGGFVNVITKSGTNQLRGSVHGFFSNDSLSSAPKNPDGSTAEEGSFDRTQGGFTLGGPLVQDKLFYFLAADVQRSSRTKQTNPNRMDPALVSFLASIGLPNENGPIERSDDAEVGLAKLDWQASSSNLATFRYSYTNSEQVNGTFDVDQWGRSANGIEQDYSHAGTFTLISTLSSNLLNEVRAQYAKEWRPRPYEGPNIPGQNRPFPDTAILFNNDFTDSGARWGMPFFLPVEYNDDRKQLTENLSYLRGNHSFKAGVEYNEVTSSQTFIGFANGRFVFLTTNDFINYYNSGGAQGVVLLYLQQAGVNGNTVVDAGRQDIEQKEPALYVQDQWRARSNLTIDYGLRWEGLDNPEVRTPANEVFFAPFIGRTVNTAAGPQSFPSDGEIPDDWEMWQPRLGISWVPDAAGKSVVRATAGVFNARLPALNLASTRSTNGSIGVTLFRSTELTPVLGAPPPYTTLIDTSNITVFLPDVFVYDKDWQTPRTTSLSLSYEREVVPDLAALVKLNYAKTDHITRFANRNDPLLGSPWSTGLPPGGANGINVLTTVESTAKSRYEGVTIGLDKRMSHNYAYQVYYTWSKDKSDDDNERDPFTFTYAKITDLDAEYGYSNRDQRHRVNAFFLCRLPWWDLDFNMRYAYRSAQPKSITATGADAASPAERINPDGSVTQRNLGRKDNVYSSLDLRLSKDFAWGGVTVQPVFEVFNVFDEENFLRPQTTNLAFNFDGTVRSGAGDPRTIQLGLKVLF